jgi:hypothetical protein
VQPLTFPPAPGRHFSCNPTPGRHRHECRASAPGLSGSDTAWAIEADMRSTISGPARRCIVAGGRDR